MAISRHNRPRTIFDLIDFPDPFLIHSSVSKNIPRYNIIDQVVQYVKEMKVQSSTPRTAAAMAAVQAVIIAATKSI